MRKHKSWMKNMQHVVLPVSIILAPRTVIATILVPFFVFYVLQGYNCNRKLFCVQCEMWIIKRKVSNDSWKIDVLYCHVLLIHDKLTAPLQSKSYMLIIRKMKILKETNILDPEHHWLDSLLHMNLTIPWHFATAWLICSKLSVGIPVKRLSSVSFGLKMSTKFNSSSGIGASTPPASKMTGTPALLAAYR